jgi:hypothetical protein
VENATAVLWKTLLIAERSFRRLDAPHRLVEVAAGVTDENGQRVKLRDRNEQEAYQKVAA